MKRLCAFCNKRTAMKGNDYCSAHWIEDTRLNILARQANLCRMCGERERMKGKSRCSPCTILHDKQRGYVPPKSSREQTLARNHNYRAKQLGNDGRLTKQDIIDLYNSTSACRYCGTVITDSNSEIDHIHPLSKGGDNEPYNLQLLCKRCNQMKSDMTHDEFVQHLQTISRLNF